jgi:cytochrome P450
MIKIQEEIENVDVMDANALALLPHFNAVINEVLRIMPPAMTGNGRMTGPNGLTVDGQFIPPGTKITAPKYVIMRRKTARKFL